jgi:hypothetical protein
MRKRSMIHRSTLLMMLSVLTLGCRHKTNTVQCPVFVAPDSLVLRSVRAVNNPTLLRGKPATLVATIQYTLVSQDNAVLETNLNQFRSANTCSRDIEGMVRLVPVSRIPISRGTHVAEVPLIWPGDTGEGTKGQVFGIGSLSIESSVVLDQLNYNLLTTRFGLAYCMQFGK